MSRSRMIGAVTALIASGALVAGCGGADDGFTAAQDAPATPAPTAPAATTPATATPAAAATTPAADPQTKALGAYPQANTHKPTFRSYNNFSRTRAGKIFVSPIPPKEDTPEVAPTAPSSTPSTILPGGTGSTGSTGGTSGGTSTPSPSPIPTVGPVGTGYTASVDVSGATQNVKAGDILQGQFTVKAITVDTVTIELLVGTFPGGTNTMDLKVGGSATLTAPGGQTYTVAVKSITPEQ